VIHMDIGGHPPIPTRSSCPFFIQHVFLYCFIIVSSTLSVMLYNCEFNMSLWEFLPSARFPLDPPWFRFTWLLATNYVNSCCICCFPLAIPSRIYKALPSLLPPVTPSTSPPYNEFDPEMEYPPRSLILL
jgi:hypothetical protein